MMRMYSYLAILAVVGAAAGADTPRNRIVRVVSVSQADLRQGPKLLDETFERLERAASFRPDIAALPEVFVDGPPEAVPGPDHRTAEPVGAALFKLCGVRDQNAGRGSRVQLRRVARSKGTGCGPFR